MVYVLTTLMAGPLGKEWRPVGVLDESQKEIADQWADASENNDWIGFEMNDLSLTGLSDKKFEPKPPTPVEQKVENTALKLEQTNATLISIIEKLAERYKDKHILGVIKGLKSEGKISSKTADVSWMSNAHWDLEKRKHAPSCPKQGAPDGKCNCLTDRLPRSLKYPDGNLGCRDCGADEDDGHDRARCPRMKQQALFASDQSTMKWHENRWFHVPGCPYRKDRFEPCNCMDDKILKDGKKLKGCSDCQMSSVHGHSSDCPRLKQQAMFASELLKRKE